MSRNVADALLLWGPEGLHVWNAGQWTRANGTPLGGRRVIVAVSRRASFVRSVFAPDVSRAEILSALRVTGNFLPVPVSDTAFDVQLTDEVGLDGRRVVVAAVRTEDLRAIQDAVKATGAKITNVVPIAFASWLAAKHHDVRDGVVVDEEPNGLGLDLVVDGQLRAVRPIGSLVNSHLDGEIERTFSSAGVPKSVVMSCASSPVADSIAASQPPAEYLLRENVDIHLEPFEDVVERARKAEVGRNRIAAVLALVAISAASLMAFTRSREAAAIQAVDSKLDTSLKHELSLQADNERRKDLWKNAGDQQSRLLNPAQRFADVLTVIAGDVPDGLWLTGVSIDRGRAMTIRGSSTKPEVVQSFVTKLSGETRLRDVKLSFANQSKIGQRTIFQFAIDAMPVGNVPAWEKPGQDVAGQKKAIGVGAAK